MSTAQSQYGLGKVRQLPSNEHNTEVFNGDFMDLLDFCDIYICNELVLRAVSTMAFIVI